MPIHPDYPLQNDRAIEALFWAITDVETSGGANNYPRFESSYAPRGERFTVQGRIVTGTGVNFNDVVRKRWEYWKRRAPSAEMATACSFGRWQILFHTAADLGYFGHPCLLWVPSLDEKYSRKRFDQILDQGARTVRQVGDAWNTGSFRDRFVNEDYCDKLVRAYELRLHPER